MKKILTVLLVLSVFTGMIYAEGSKEQGAEKAAWPKGTVQVIVPAKAGGGTDVMARVFTDYIQRTIDSPVVVVNQPAGGGTVAYEQVRNAKPDGLTLLFNHTGILINYHTGRYEHPVSEFTTLAIAQSYPPQVYGVAPDAPWDTLKDFVEDARKNPGKYKVGISLGGTTHFIAGTIMMNENVDLKLVEASSEVDKVAAIQGGHIDIGNLGAASAQQYVDAGKMKVLCMIDPIRYEEFPDFIPAIEQGVNVTWIAPLVLWGPAGMDPAIVEAVNASIKDMGNDPTVMDQLKKMSSAFSYMTVPEAQNLIANEDAKIKALSEKLGIAAH